MATISREVLAWHKQHGRHNLPWQNTTDPYRIWVSEIMLQQTQVATVIPYYQRFMQQFATIEQLAAADVDQVLHLWTGLGYYARARNLHKTAQIISAQYRGVFPQQFDDVLALPGIGRSTAGAILAFSTGQHFAILDGNVKRVLSRFYEVEGWYGKKAVENKLWELAEHNTPTQEIQQYTQAIMDFGASLCTRSKPNCNICPLNKQCGALQNKRTHELPHSKPKTTKPVKQTVMLFIQNNKGEVLLQRRPPAGIWGGLWCPPTIESISEPANIDGTIVHISKQLDVFRHTFSHYHLDITPTLAELDKSSNMIAESDERIWYNANSPQAIGLAAPIKTLLQKIAR